jgi:hypothetical protein
LGAASAKRLIPIVAVGTHLVTCTYCPLWDHDLRRGTNVLSLTTGLHADHDHASPDCLTPETTTHGVLTWRACGPAGHRLYLLADAVELDAPALDALLTHLTAERRNM